MWEYYQRQITSYIGEGKMSIRDQKIQIEIEELLCIVQRQQQLFFSLLKFLDVTCFLVLQYDMIHVQIHTKKKDERSNLNE